MAHVYKVKHGIETAVSVPLIVSSHVDEETGETVEFVEEQTFLPGATLPENLAAYFVEKIEDEDDEHTNRLIETVEVEDKPKPKTAPKKQEARASSAKKATEKKADEDNPFTAASEE